MLEVEVVQLPGGRRVERFDKTTLIVGRSAKCDIIVRDPDVSRRHLRIELVDGELWAEDMGSSNGSTVDGEPLAKRSRFAQGQTLRVCDHEMRIRIVDANASALPQPSIPAPPPVPTMAQKQPPPLPRMDQAPAMAQTLSSPGQSRPPMASNGSVSPRSVACSEGTWEALEQIAREQGRPVDEVVNEALANYARRRIYANAGSTASPHTSLEFTDQPPHSFMLSIGRRA